MQYYQVDLINGHYFTMAVNRYELNDTHHLFYINGINAPFCSLAVEAVGCLTQQDRPIEDAMV